MSQTKMDVWVANIRHQLSQIDERMDGMLANSQQKTIDQMTSAEWLKILYGE